MFDDKLRSINITARDKNERKYKLGETKKKVAMIILLKLLLSREGRNAIKRVMNSCDSNVSLLFRRSTKKRSR